MTRVYACVIGSVLVLALMGSCDKGRLNAKNLQKKIDATLAADGMIATTTCPKINKNSKVTCIAKTKDGTEITIDVVTDAKRADYKVTNAHSGKKVADLLTRLYLTKSKVALTAVTCPEAVIVGKEARCTANAESIPLSIRVTTTGKNVNFVADPDLITTESLTAGLRRKTKTKVTLDCGTRLRLAEPGKRFTCTASDPSGKKAVVHYKIVNTKGRVVDGLTPPP